MREFPIEFDAKNRPLLFYPENPPTMEGDFLEIGPGNGRLLWFLTEKFPDKKIVAVEIGKDRFKKIASQIKKRKLANLQLIGGDARIALPQYFKENSFEKIFVLFSDPWPKKRHAFRRLLQLPFLWFLSFLLKKGGHLILATDEKNYADFMIENLKQIEEMKNDLPADFENSLPELPKTYFEEKWRNEGRNVYFMRWVKR